MSIAVTKRQLPSTFSWEEVVRQYWNCSYFNVFGNTTSSHSTGSEIPPLYIFVEPVCVVTLTEDGTIVTNALGETSNQAFSSSLLDQYIFAPYQSLTKSEFGTIPFVSAFISYEYLHRLENIPAAAPEQLQIPQLCFVRYRKVIKHDNIKNSLELFELTDSESSVSPLWEFKPSNIAAAGSVQASPQQISTFAQLEQLEQYSNFNRLAYLQAIKTAQQSIKQGDIYQINLSQRFTLPCEASPADLFLTAPQTTPSRYSSFISLPEYRKWIISTSPERYFEVCDNKIICSPIKGTRPRLDDPVADVEMVRSLCESKKENAELSMIVDLVRNDLSKIALPGSVKVRQHANVDSLPQVHHLYSDVQAECVPGTHCLDIINALFPCASITGAPKLSAMQIIQQLEQSNRGIYTGAIGYCSPRTMCFNVAIRTATVTPTEFIFQAGGGIVWESDPESEYQETLIKAAGLLQTWHQAHQKHTPITVAALHYKGHSADQSTESLPLTI